MTFESKYSIGQVVEFNSLNKIKTGTICGVFFGTGETQYEVDDEGFLDESRITAIFTRQEVSAQIELPLTIGAV